MEESILHRIQRSLLEKHRTVTGWLETAPEAEIECCLSDDDEQPVQEHLQVIDETLEKVENETLGVCKVCNGHVDESILEIDYTASICLDCLSDQERRNLETELEFSAEVQRALLPQQAPAIPGLDIAAFSRPAQIIGGDYFDFFKFRNHTHGMVIADVMGHGVSASLLMSSLQTALHTLIPDADSAAEVIRRVNHYYLHNINLTAFVTVFLGQYDPNAHELVYCNAGHNPPLLYRKQPDQNGQATWLRPTGAAIGLVEEYKLRSDKIFLQEGDILLLYTDGLTEATNPNGEELGRERLPGLIAENANLSARDMISALRKGLADFTGGGILADDLTMVVCKVPGKHS